MNFLKLISGHLLNYGDQVIKSVKVFKLFFICTNYYKQVLYNTIRGFLPRPLFFFEGSGQIIWVESESSESWKFYHSKGWNLHT